MKKFILILSAMLFLLTPFFTLVGQSIYPIPLEKRVPKFSPTPKSAVYIPFSAAIEENGVLNVYFDSLVGICTVTITDDSGEVMSNNIIDSEVQQVLSISTESWNIGFYTLTIECMSGAFLGDFEL